MFFTNTVPNTRKKAKWKNVSLAEQVWGVGGGLLVLLTDHIRSASRKRDQLFPITPIWLLEGQSAGIFHQVF